ncbi:MAG: helix-turn-helix transcriptional regulator [Lachnospiraceae bacterium]|nr:helix-turn-helix transcriptional regulator [Lachnospiraceae bacterium]
MKKEEIIGRNIRWLRLERGYSQERLAELIGFNFSQKQISRYEKGEVKRLNYVFLKLIATVFEVEIGDLEDENYVKVSTGKGIN